MRSRILKCSHCGLYTLKQTCPKCEGSTSNTFPARYSPEDKYGKYRRMHYLEKNNIDDQKREE